jgi:hypothetical protein
MQPLDNQLQLDATTITNNLITYKTNECTKSLKSEFKNHIMSIGLYEDTKNSSTRSTGRTSTQRSPVLIFPLGWGAGLAPG